jgi:hypothetical protein
MKQFFLVVGHDRREALHPSVRELKHDRPALIVKPLGCDRCPTSERA